jgi:Zn-dependent M16 (insulinase) family peptidase
MTGILPELLPYAFLLTDVLGKVNTKDFSYQDLSTYTNKYTGGISFQILSVVDSKNLEKYSINFSLKAKVLSENISKLMHILQNLALSTDFSDKGRIKEILEEVKADWDANFFARGLNVATARMLAYFSPANRVGELDSYSYYMFIRELAANYE